MIEYLDLSPVHQVVLSTVAMVFIIIFLGFVFKRSKLLKLGNNKKINIVSNVLLGKKERLVLVEVDAMRLLIGVTAQSVTALYKTENGTYDKENVDFLDCLKSETLLQR